MKIPKSFHIIITYIFVIRVIWLCVLEWKTTHNNCKNDNSKSKDISGGGMVLFMGGMLEVVDLRSHVAFLCSFKRITHREGVVVGGVGKPEVS